RRAEPVEQQPGETVPGLGRAYPEEKGNLGGKCGAEFLAAFVERDFEFRQRVFVELRLGQIDDRLDRGDDPMSARTGKQGRVVATALVAIAVRQVDDFW